MHKFLGFLAALAAATALFALSAGQALGNHVQCGDFITHDTTLDSDLSCPNGHYDYSSGECVGGIGLYAGATLDLGGHVIAGPGRDSYPYCLSEGIQGGRTIKNGTIRGFDTGIYSGQGATLERLVIRDNQEGIYGSGIREIRDNTLVGNVYALNIGSYGGPDACQCKSPVTIERNNVDDTLGDGITVAGPSDVLLSRNVVTDSGGSGINIYSILGGYPPQTHEGTFSLTKNRTDRNGLDGIHTDVVSTLLSKNEASFNGNLGIEAMSGVSGSKNRATGNGDPAQCVPSYLCSTTGKPKP